MHILSVQVMNYGFSEEKGRHQATLLMVGDHNRVCLRAAAELSPKSHKKEVIHGLMADAIRQIKRLPEFRNASNGVTVARNAMPI